MTQVIAVSLKDLPRKIAADMRARERRIERALAKTARDGAKVVRRNASRAFGDLQDSVHAERQRRGGKIVTDAPHAAASERGSRPHFPPIEPLIRWVKLRGMQGLASDKQLARMRGPTTAKHARSVAEQLSGIRRGGRIGPETPYTPVDAAEQVARAIQHAIGKHGTKPTWFTMQSLPSIREILDVNVRAAMPEP